MYPDGSNGCNCARVRERGPNRISEKKEREKGRERKGIVVALKIRTSGIHQRQEPDVHIHSPTLI